PVVRAELDFEEHPVSDVENDSAEEVDVQGLDTTRSGRRTATVVETTAAWPTDSSPSPDRSVSTREISKVAFGRIPRQQVPTMLPRIVADTAPLRGMMERRS